MNTETPLCEVCDLYFGILEVDLNTDEESGPVMWLVCAQCAQELIDHHV